MTTDSTITVKGWSEEQNYYLAASVRLFIQILKFLQSFFGLTWPTHSGPLSHSLYCAFLKSNRIGRCERGRRLGDVEEHSGEAFYLPAAGRAAAALIPAPSEW